MNIKNRGAISNPEGRFDKEIREEFDDGWEKELETLPPLETILFLDHAKSLITKNKSPDLGFEQSINPYRGCEHGCIYCYARPSHAYMDMSPGLDFETKIFYKADAAKLLAEQLEKPKYICQSIVLGANTDPYQPIEAKLKISRQILETLNRYNHPVIIITKGALIERDLDILSDMAERQLIKVAVSITTLSTELKHIMEPRTATPRARLRVVNKLSSAGIPVRIMAAPMIPLINDMEMEKILKAASESGAQHASYTFIRLPYEVKNLFKQWLAKHFPERAEHVMSIIRQMRGGKEYDATFGKRMRGEGEFADLLAMRFKLACKRFKLNLIDSPTLNTQSFKRCKEIRKQLDLWDENSDKF